MEVWAAIAAKFSGTLNTPPYEELGMAMAKNVSGSAGKSVTAEAGRDNCWADSTSCLLTGRGGLRIQRNLGGRPWK